jgi:hypothetical protein
LSTIATGFSARIVRGVDDLEVGAKLAQYQRHLTLEGDQRIADVALREGGGRCTAAAVEHWHVGEDAADQRLGSVRARATLDRRAPGGEVGVAAVAGDLRIRDHDRHALLAEVAPVADGLRVALAHQDDRQRRARRRAVRVALGPIGRHQAAVGQEVDVQRLVHRHDVGFEALGHRTHLRARAAVALLDVERGPGRLLPVGQEDAVEVLVELARDVIAHVEQVRRLGGPGRRHAHQRGSQGQRHHKGTAEQIGHGVRPLVNGKRNAMMETLRAPDNESFVGTLFAMRMKQGEHYLVA